MTPQASAKGAGRRGGARAASRPTATVVRRCGPEDGPAVAKVLTTVFPEKFAATFGRHIDRGERLLASLYARLGGVVPVFLAEVNGKVAGLADLRFGGERKTRGTRLFSTVVRGMGWLGFPRSVMVFHLLTWGALERDSAYVGFLGVMPEFRGRGIGLRLLDRAAQEARRAGKRRLVLDVEAENQAAIGLYRDYGFRKTRTYRSRLTRWFSGVWEWEVWELAL